MSTEAQRTAVAALRTITRARIACTNTIAELEVVDALTDDWDLEVANLTTASMEIHLQSEFSAKEASTILANLTGIMNNGRLAVLEEWLCMELEVRRENAVVAVQAIMSVIDGLDKVVNGEDLGLAELTRRAEFIVGRLEGLKDLLVKLTADWAAAIQASAEQAAQAQADADAKQRESVADVFRYVGCSAAGLCLLCTDFLCSPHGAAAGN